MKNFRNNQSIKPKKGLPSPNQGVSGDLSLNITKSGIGLYGKVGNQWYKFGSAQESSSTGVINKKKGLLKQDLAVKSLDVDRTIDIGNTAITTNPNRVYSTTATDTDYLYISSKVFDVESNNTASKIYIGDISLQPTWGTTGSTLKLENAEGHGSDLKILGAGSTGVNKNGGDTILSSGLKTGAGTSGSIILGAGDSGTSNAAVLDINASSTTISGTLTIGTIDTDTAGDNYLVEVSGVVKKRTPAEVLSDIGGQATITAGTNCTFSGATLNVDNAFILNNADDTMAGTLTIDKNSTATTNGVTYGLKVDYDHTGIAAGGQAVQNYGVESKINTDSPTHVGAVYNFGYKSHLIAGTSGVQENYGYYGVVTGGDQNFGMLLDVVDGGVDYRARSSANTADHFSMSTTTNGATTLATVDADATLAHLTLAPDGNLLLQPSSEIIKIPGDTKLTFGTNSANDHIYADPDAGEIYIAMNDSDVMTFYDDRVDVGVQLETNEIMVTEAASAVADRAGKGQIWVKNDTPNNLYFTNDAGNDVQITNGASLAGGGGSSGLNSIVAAMVFG